MKWMFCIFHIFALINLNTKKNTMKKHLLFFSSFIAFSLNAQLYITKWDVAQVGNIMTVAHDTLKPLTTGAINPGPAGLNKTWNFSTLIAHTTDTLTVTNPNWLPYSSNFPNANIAIVNSTDSSQIYLNDATTGLFVEGAYGNPTGQGTMAIPFNPAEQIIAFVDTFNTHFVNVSKIQFEFPFSITQLPTVDSARVKRTTTKDVLTDGLGNITTPLGTFNSLRHRGMVVNLDSVFLHNSAPSGWFPAPAPYDVMIDTLWHFSWWTNGAGNALLEFDSTKADTIRNINWLKSLPVLGSVHETSVANGLNIYPNPAVSQINFEINTPAISSLEIFDLSGRKITSLPANKSKNIITYNVDVLPSGTYFYNAINTKGNSLKRGVFNVVK